MKQELYAHFHPEERPFVDRVLDWIDAAAVYHERKTTDFLDPRQQSILESLARRNGDVRLLMDGGYEGAERKRVWLAPDYAEPEDGELAIVVLAIESDDPKAAELEHGDYLGALLGLGIKRDKIGDLHVRPDGCHALVAGEMSAYLDVNLRQVHRAAVRTDILTVDKLIEVQPMLEVMNLSVASLRLDGVLSDVVRVSRAKIMPPIKAGRCRVNWRVEEDPSAEVKPGDVISLQGFGRFCIMELEGQSKSGRIRLKVGKFV